MLYLLKSYLRDKFIYKVGFSEDSNIQNRLEKYFYTNPGSKVISLRRGDEMLEDLIHYYLYYLGFRFQLGGRLNEWFIGDQEVHNIFHISRESLESKLWKHRNKLSLDFQLFRYLYSKHKESFIGQSIILNEFGKPVRTKAKPIDEIFYKVLIRHYPSEVFIPISIEKGILKSKYYNDIEKEIQDFLDNKFYKTGIFEIKMKLYCEFMDKYKGNKEVSDMLYFKIKDPKYRKYYNFYGTSGCRAVSYIEDKLKLGMIDTSKESELSSVIYKKFKSNNRYTLKEIKSILQDLYRDLGITSKAKATDLKKIF